jgi:hypothetical protein
MTTRKGKPRDVTRRKGNGAGLPVTEAGAKADRSYNTGDVMMAMGLSWQDTVRPMLDDSRHLPIDQARKLLAMIEERPVTKERLTQSFLEAAEEIDPGSKEEPPDFGAPLLKFLQERHGQLVAILRKSVELNERLLCSISDGLRPMRFAKNYRGRIPIKGLVDLTYTNSCDELVSLAALICEVDEHPDSADLLEARLSKLDDPADHVLLNMAVKFAEGKPYHVTTNNPENVERHLSFAKHVGATVESIQRGGLEEMTYFGCSGVAERDEMSGDEFTLVVFRPPSPQKQTGAA